VRRGGGRPVGRSGDVGKNNGDGGGVTANGGDGGQGQTAESGARAVGLHGKGARGDAAVSDAPRQGWRRRTARRGGGGGR